LEKHINRAEEKSALSRWSSGLVAVALGFLLEITLLEGNPNLIYRLRYNIARVWINLNWLHMVLGILLGIPYTTVFLADMVDKRRIRDCDDNSFDDGRMEKRSKRFLPNPTLLIAVLLGTVFVTSLDLIAGPVTFGKCTWYGYHASWGVGGGVTLILLILGSILLGTERFINNTEDSIPERLCAVLVAGVMSCVIQLIFFNNTLSCFGLATYNDLGPYTDVYIALGWVKIVLSLFIGFLYASIVLVEVTENQGKLQKHRNNRRDRRNVITVNAFAEAGPPSTTTPL